jgi:hypothetical protein
MINKNQKNYGKFFNLKIIATHVAQTAHIVERAIVVAVAAKWLLLITTFIIDNNNAG